MKRCVRSTVMAITFLVLAACAGASPSPTPWWTIHDEAFATLKPGITNKADVRRLIGTPRLERNFPRQGEEVWEYRCLEGTTMVMLVWVYFDTGGTFKHYMHFPDPAYISGSES